MSAAGLGSRARELLARRAARVAGGQIPRRTDEAEAPPLSPAQLPHWTFAVREPSSPVLNLAKRVRVAGALDEGALARAIDTIVRRHEPLRTAVIEVKGVPRQDVRAARPCTVTRVDLRALPEPEREAACERHLDADARRPFDLRSPRGDLLVRAVVVQLADDERELQLTFHHLAFDGWSTSVFFSELAAAYANESQATGELRVPDLPLRFGDVAAWEHARAMSPERAAAVDAWRARMRDADLAFDLGADRERPAAPTHAAHVVKRDLTREVHQAVDALARSEGLTTFAIVAAALQVLVARRTASADPVIGVVSAGRRRAELEALIGNFMYTLPLRVRLGAGRSFREHARAVHAAWLDGYAQGDLALVGHAADVFPTWEPVKGPLFQVLFNFRNMPAPDPALPGLVLGPLRTPVLGTTVDLHFSVSATPDRLSLELVASADRFERETAERWVDGLLTLFGAIARDPDAPLESLTILPPPERERVLVTWNTTAAPAPSGLAHTALARRATSHPDDVALVFGAASLDYGALWRSARAFSATLVSMGAGPGTRVGICTQRGFELAIGLFGILEAGAAFVALDPQQPPARLAAMASDAQITLLVAPPELAAHLPGWSGPRAWPSIATAGSAPDLRPLPAAGPGPAPDDLAWIAYTSGTSGTPKGCMVEHHSVFNLLVDRVRQLELSPESVLLQVAALGFEGAFDMLLAAQAGCRLVLVDPDVLASPPMLVDLLRRGRVTHASFTPGMLAAVAPADLPSLRCVTIGGEAAGRDLYLRWRDATRRVWNEYGPTECTVWCALEEVLPEHATIGVGRAVAGTRLYVLDARMEPAPIGVAGELYIAGRAVGRGYHGRPALTAERFLADPFAPGERMYRTGDRARWLTRGSVAIMGRVDRQLKVAGQRIEPAEIEHALRGHPGIADVVVTPWRPDRAPPIAPDESPPLVAHYTTLDARPCAPDALRRTLRAHLPVAMWPASFVHMRVMPLTPNGKIDLARLPAPPPSCDSGAALADDPDPLRGVVAEIWRKLLPRRDFGPDDAFLDVGGHSLLAAHMLHELALATGVELPLSSVLAGATIRSIAHAIALGAARRETCECVCVQPGAPDRPALFLLHGDYGGIGAYCRLIARAVGPEHPVYALAPIPEAFAGACTSIEAAAAIQLAAIRRVRPRGPYRLYGYCASGLIAYEVACRLQREGERVELLALADSRPWVLPGPLTDLSSAIARRGGPDPDRRRAIEAALMPRLQLLRELSLIASARYLLGGLSRLARRRTFLAKVTRPAGARVEPLSWPQRYGRLRLRWVPSAFHGRLDLLWATGHGPRVHANRWRGLVETLAVTEVARTHEEVVATDVPGFVAAAVARIDR